MLMRPPAVRIYVARDAVDMRKSFDGLAALTQFALGERPPRRRTARAVARQPGRQAGRLARAVSVSSA
jgi:hypothetical protein